MPVLKNQKHERFAQAVALGMPASKAYRQHVAEDPNGDPNAIDPAASRLSSDIKVSSRISELREKVAAKVESKFAMTKDKWLDELAAIASEARQTGDFSAASGALAHIGKASAYFEPERHKLEIEVIIGGNAESQNQD